MTFHVVKQINGPAAFCGKAFISCFADKHNCFPLGNLNHYLVLNMIIFFFKAHHCSLLQLLSLQCLTCLSFQIFLSLCFFSLLLIHKWQRQQMTEVFIWQLFLNARGTHIVVIWHEKNLQCVEGRIIWSILGIRFSHAVTVQCFVWDTYTQVDK